MKLLKNKIVYEENINNIKGKATAIVFPENLEEIASLVKLCGSETDIIARGNGTSFTGATIPDNSVIVDFSKMSKILLIDAEKRIAIVEPGVLLSELNDELKPYGLEFPIIPLFQGLETLGGLIAKNSSGNREIKYSRVMNWINYLEVINSKGEHVKIAKSDLSDYLGMEGTTGIIVGAALRLTHIKQRSLTILKASTLQDVFIANRKLRLKQDISAIDLFSPIVSSLLGLEKKYHIFVELENNNGAFKGQDYEKYLKLKDKAYKKSAEAGYIYLSNAKFLVDSLQDFLLYLEEKKTPFFSHLASGVVYSMFKPEEIDGMNEATKFARKSRGKIAYNFGIGLTKKDFLELGEKELIKRVKKRQDPFNKFNRNKLVDLSFLLLESARRPAILGEKKEPEQQTGQKHEEKIEKKEQEEKIEENKQEDIIRQSETATLKRPEPELTPEEKEKVKRIAFGFFGGKKEANPEKPDKSKTEEADKEEKPKLEEAGKEEISKEKNPQIISQPLPQPETQ